jgi:hypothetical protein
MSEIFYAQVVTEYDTEHFVVKRMFYNKPNPYLNATLLSPLPDGAMRTSLDISKTHYCFCAKDGMHTVILGFVPPHGSSSFNDVDKPDNEKNGFELATGPVGMLKGYEDGSVGVLADPWAQILFEPRPKSITVKAKNLIVNLWTGFVNYITSEDRVNLKIFISKFLDKTSIAGYENSQTPDSITTEIGTIQDTTAIKRETVLQNFDNNHTVGTTITKGLGGDNVYKLTYTDRDTKADVTLIFALDGSFTYDNTKCAIIIDKEGKTSITVNGGAKFIMNTNGTVDVNNGALLVHKN